MNKHKALMSFKKTSAILQAAVIASAALLPAMLLSSSASGAQLDNRFIDLSADLASTGDGSVSGTNVTYTVAFDLGTDHTNLEGIVVQFCGDSPIVDDVCTAAAGFDLATPTVSANANTNLGGATDIDPSGWTVDATDPDYIILSDATGIAGTAGDTVAFDILGVTNPSALGTFYARITTYTDSTVAAAYTYVGTTTTTGAYLDEGGIALSTASELTVTARVQEVLEFCVGTETSSVGLVDDTDSCAEVSGTNLSLDVVDSNSIATTSNIDTPNDGVMMIRTNAVNGAVMFYKAEQDGSANAGQGALKINGVDCSVTLTDLDDACFNSVGTTRAVITAGTERFGLALKERLLTYGGATDDVVCDVNYAGDGNTTLGASCDGIVVGSNYAWDDTGVFDTLATSAGPVDDELVALEFAATASPTTPTGLYTVTANFVATSTF